MVADPLIELRNVNKFMADGRIVEDRAPDDVFTAPRGERARVLRSGIPHR